MKHSFIAITLRSTLTCIGSMSQIELFNHLLRIIISYLKPYNYAQIIYIT